MLSIFLAISAAIAINRSSKSELFSTTKSLYLELYEESGCKTKNPRDSVHTLRI